MKTKKILTWCLRFFIGLILIVILMNKIDATKIIDQILNMDLIILPLFLLLFPILFLATAMPDLSLGGSSLLVPQNQVVVGSG